MSLWPNGIGIWTRCRSVGSLLYGDLAGIGTCGRSWFGEETWTWILTCGSLGIRRGLLSGNGFPLSKSAVKDG